ncbi:MAG TPA: glycosyltransferase family 87 protein [Chthoniobacter sp.]|nr:glycosyltransferase family 87 protein [Chthoniobacter sp.]
MILYVGRITYQVATRNGQDDLKIYYDRTARYVGGQNPYDKDLPALTPGVRNHFVYPPATLEIFKALLVFDLPTLLYVYYGVKLVALGLLFLFWYRIANPDTTFFLLLTLVCLFAYNRPIGLDCRAGNISVFEQCFVWGGVWCFLRGRAPLFCLLILCSAFFKIVTLPLVFLLVANGDRKSFLWAAGSSAAFVIFQALSYIMQPDLFHGFVRNAGSLDERGISNPASLAFFRDFVELLHVAPTWNRSLATVLYALFALLVFSLACWAAVRSSVWRNKVAWIMLFFLTYALLSPRFKDYSYILLILPSAYVLKTCLSSWIWRLVVLFVLSGNFFVYQPFVAACLVWGIYVHSLIRAQSLGGERSCERGPDAVNVSTTCLRSHFGQIIHA